jgi:hypothetical protein
MKRFGIILFLTALLIQGYSQEGISKEKQVKETTDTLLKSDAESPEMLASDNSKTGESRESMRIRIGNRGMEILERLEGGHKIRFESYPENDDLYYRDQDSDGKEKKHRSYHHFRGHWTGVEFGFNNFMTAGYSMVLPNSIGYMELNSGKSNCFNFNFAQQSLGITRHFGFVTGLGLNWNNYRFDGNNNIEKNGNGEIVEYIPTSTLEKSKLSTLYLTVPLLLELQIPTEDHHLNISAGVIGAVKLGSHTRMDFKNGDKIKSDEDLSLNLLRYGPTARVGFRNFSLYATYYMTPLFKEGKGPGGYDIYPFEVGCAFTFNN